MKLSLVDDSRLGFASASKMGAIFKCDGLLGMESIVEKQKITPPEGGADAAHGTLIHAHAQTGDVTGLDPADAETVELIRQTEEKVVGDWIVSTGHTLSDVTVYRELRLWVPGYFSGQSDTLVINFANETALISDTKSGRKPVPPPVRNWQLRSLALAVFLRFKVKSVRTIIIQPYVKEMPYCDYNEEHLKTIDERIRERIDLVKTPGLKRTAGDWCEHCRALHICPEAKQSIQMILRDESRLNWDSLTAEKKVALWKAAEMAQNCIDSITDMIKKELANDPNSIPGLVKAKDQAPRSIKNPREFVTALVDFIFGPNQELADMDTRKLAMVSNILSFMKISFADAAAFLKAVQGTSKKQAEALLENSFGEFVERGFRSGSVGVVEEEKK